MFLNYYKHRKYYDKMLKHLVSCLFILLLRNYNKYYIPDKNSQKELKIMRYLQEHYADATLEHAAAYFNYSTSYFSRMVKHNTGCNFTELLVNTPGACLSPAAGKQTESRGRSAKSSVTTTWNTSTGSFGRNLTGRDPVSQGTSG